MMHALIVLSSPFLQRALGVIIRILIAAWLFA
jgi:hypothetical protein